MADLAGCLKSRELADGILERHLRIDAVKLIQIDARKLQSP
jgi:hypothetical protein